MHSLTKRAAIRSSSSLATFLWLVALLSIFLPSHAWAGDAKAKSKTSVPAAKPVDPVDQDTDEEVSDSGKADGERYRSLETLARGMFYLETLYYDPQKVTQESLVSNALRGITSNLDPHTIYMPKEAFKELTIDTQGKFGGVGIMVSPEKGKLLVVSTIEDTPAYKAGIKAGDEILEIDGSPVKEMKSGFATEKMRGEPGSVLALAIKRNGSEKPLVFKLTREIINVQSVHSVDLGGGVLYSRIANFQDNTTQEEKSAIEKYLKKGPINGLILDLRDNPGGLLEQAVGISGLFIDSGVIVSTVGRTKDDVEREFAHKRGTYTDFPIIVLINGGSASASEIVAGALQDHERALILGTTSFGKGSVQTLISLPDGAGLKITVARYFTPKDRSIQARGIEPDFVVEQNSPEKDRPLTITAPKSPRETGGPIRKEADFKGHIVSEDLSDMAKNTGMLKIVEKWPEETRNDRQLLTAYTYLHGWSIFRKKSTDTTPDPSKSPKMAGAQEPTAPANKPVPSKN